MRRLMVCSAIVVVAFMLFVGPAIGGRIKYPNYRISHASDGMGLTNGSLSLHRTFASRHAMFDTFTIYGVPYSWTRPVDTAFLMAPWTSSSVASCGHCHTTVNATTSTPASGFPEDFATLRLDGSTVSGMSSGSVICAKCHDLITAGVWSNVVHASTRHRGVSGQCVSCHVQMPHGSGLPRLLGYSQDPYPFSTLATGVAGIRLQNYTPTSWAKRDCSSSCHLRAMTQWPSGGSIGGEVRDAEGSTVTGARVEVSTLVATTTVTGAFRIDAVGAGYAKLKVSKDGYVTSWRDIIITAGALLTQDATLTAAP